MPRRNRNPGKGRPPHNGPARSHRADKAGPGAGDWATGTGGAPKRPDFEAETARLAAALRDDPDAKAAREAVAAEMLAVLVDVARHDDSGAARANAADKALDRMLGKATQRQEVTGKDGAALVIVTGVPRGD